VSQKVSEAEEEEYHSISL